MSTIGFVMMVIGMLMCLGAFIFGVVNMAGSGFDDFDNMFKRHGAAMIVMAIGMCIGMLGLGLFGWPFLAALLAV